MIQLTVLSFSEKNKNSVEVELRHWKEKEIKCMLKYRMRIQQEIRKYIL